MSVRGSETTVAIVSTPRTVIRTETESEIRGMNLRVALPRASAFCGPTPVHLRVPLHDLVVRDPVDLLLDRELVLRLPCLHDSTGGGFALELRDEELPFSATGLERRDHLGAVEHNVAGAHMELVDDRLAQVQEEVVLRREDELSAEIRLTDVIEAILHGPHDGPLSACEEAFHEPSLRHEFPQSLAGLSHVVLESGVRGERLGGRHAEAADDPPQDFAAGVIPANLQVRDRTITVVRIPRHMEALVQLTERRRRCGAAQVREDQQPLAGNPSLLPDDPEGGLHVLREAGGLGGFVQAEIFFRAVRPILGDREAFGEKPAAVKPFQRAKLLHPEWGGAGSSTSSGAAGSASWAALQPRSSQISAMPTRSPPWTRGESQPCRYRRGTGAQSACVHGSTGDRTRI